jgi:hypothetical protein
MSDPPKKAAKKAPAKKVAARKPEAAPIPRPRRPRKSEPPSAAALWAKIKDEPEYAPETLASAAVAQYGPAAKDWAARLRKSYPDAPAHGLARLAVDRYTRLARRAGAAAGLAGPLGPVAGVGSLAVLQAQLVLHIAAAYGVDPTSPDRAAELLSLTGAQRRVLRWAGAWTVWRAASRLVPGASVVLGAYSNANEIRGLAMRALAFYRATARNAKAPRTR